MVTLEYMALAALVLMYSLGLALGLRQILGLQMPCTDVTMLQLLLKRLPKVLRLPCAQKLVSIFETVVSISG